MTSESLEIPYLGSMVQAVADGLHKLQALDAELLVVQVAGAHDDDDSVPGLTPPRTFAERRRELGDAQQRLVDAFPRESQTLHDRQEQ